MKNIKAVIIICAAGVYLTSCTNWLNIKPFDQTLDDELYSTERGVNMALNGLYLSMADASLYGKNLTYYTSELLGQRYNFYWVSNATYAELVELPYFYYTNKNVVSHLDKIFAKAYKVIYDTNYFIERASKTKAVGAEKKNLLLGEAYAIRAFLHFDMLRFYGFPPILDKKGGGIPYCTEATSEWRETLQNGEVIELLLKDIDTALDYLKDDPILTTGVNLNDEGYDFYDVYRNRRLNYLAVKALKARVLFWAADSASVGKAGEIVLELIGSEAFQNAFPWISVTETDPAKIYLKNSVYTSEVMFGIHVASMYDDWSTWFNTSSSDNYGTLPTTRETLVYMYDTGSNAFNTSPDPRAGLWRESLLSSDSDLFLSSKFSRPNASAASHLFNFQPLMRKSEVYLMAAEIFGDVAYVDEIREYRGLNPLDVALPGYDLQEQIRKEYMKDFVSEGQLFYYYKRRAETSIWGMSGAKMQEITVSDPGAAYVPPMPKNETEV